MLAPTAAAHVKANTGPDAASCSAGHLDVFAVGQNGDFWRNGYNGTSWSGWSDIGGQWTSDPGAACRRGTAMVDVFGRGLNNGLWVDTVPGS